MLGSAASASDKRAILADINAPIGVESADDINSRPAEEVLREEARAAANAGPNSSAAASSFFATKPPPKPAAQRLAILFMSPVSEQLCPRTHMHAREGRVAPNQS